MQNIKLDHIDSRKAWQRRRKAWCARSSIPRLYFLIERWVWYRFDHWQETRSASARVLIMYTTCMGLLWAYGNCNDTSHYSAPGPRCQLNRTGVAVGASNWGPRFVNSPVWMPLYLLIFLNELLHRLQLLKALYIVVYIRKYSCDKLLC